MTRKSPHIIILGTAQDGGYPQAGCEKECCRKTWGDSSLRRLTTSIAIINPETNEKWLIDSTPDFREQIHILNTLYLWNESRNLSGIFLTHGHIGHYTGLIHLGREVMNTNSVDVYAMPMMFDFLNGNAPWNQLIINNNIRLNSLSDNIPVTLTDKISITPFLVPHRSEITETIGYKITGPNKTLVFIPDIDNWNEIILKIIRTTDIALVDGTFFNADELSERNIIEIQHPFITESMKLFNQLPQKDKIHFIHFNHTNPIINSECKAHKMVKESGFKIAQEKQIIEL
jgi:pyrroloquinoline quinone biosynthesis protein B